MTYPCQEFPTTFIVPDRTFYNLHLRGAFDAWLGTKNGERLGICANLFFVFSFGLGASLLVLLFFSHPRKNISEEEYFLTKEDYPDT
jgi:hypothetical protein